MKMDIEFKKVSDFSRGIFLKLLQDAYSSNQIYQRTFNSDWQASDNFYFDNLQIADNYGFVTALNGEAIGFVFWDPRHMPEYAEIGHNCIASKYKGNGYGKLQLQEAVRRIIQNDVKKIIVSTNEDLVPAQRMYESIGFTFYQKRKNDNPGLADYIDYKYLIK